MAHSRFARMFMVVAVAATCVAMATAAHSAAEPVQSMDDRLMSATNQELYEDARTRLSENIRSAATNEPAPLEWAKITANLDFEELRALDPLGIMQGMAIAAFKYMASSQYKGPLFASTRSQAACLVGSLTNGFVAARSVTVSHAHAEPLLAKIYVEFDNPALSLAEAQAALRSGQEPPAGVASYSLGASLGAPACYAPGVHPGVPEQPGKTYVI